MSFLSIFFFLKIARIHENETTVFERGPFLRSLEFAEKRSILERRLFFGFLDTA